MTQFIVNKRTDASKTDVNLLTRRVKTYSKGRIELQNSQILREMLKNDEKIELVFSSSLNIAGVKEDASGLH